MSKMSVVVWQMMDVIGITDNPLFWGTRHEACEQIGCTVTSKGAWLLCVIEVWFHWQNGGISQSSIIMKHDAAVGTSDHTWMMDLTIYIFKITLIKARKVLHHPSVSRVEHHTLCWLHYGWGDIVTSVLLLCLNWTDYLYYKVDVEFKSMQAWAVSTCWILKGLFV